MVYLVLQRHFLKRDKYNLRINQASVSIFMSAKKLLISSRVQTTNEISKFVQILIHSTLLLHIKCGSRYKMSRIKTEKYCQKLTFFILINRGFGLVNSQLITCCLRNSTFEIILYELKPKYQFFPRNCGHTVGTYVEFLRRILRKVQKLAMYRTHGMLYKI